MGEAVIIALITAGLPCLATLITTVATNRQSRKFAAKQTILQMCMEDQLNWELFRKFPMNYGNIQDEYQIYHNAGGNGEVTKRVHEYNEWYATVEEMVAKGTPKGGANGRNQL